MFIMVTAFPITPFLPFHLTRAFIPCFVIVSENNNKGRGGETVTMTAWDCFHQYTLIINLLLIIKDVIKTGRAHTFFFLRREALPL